MDNIESFAKQCGKISSYHEANPIIYDGFHEMYQDLGLGYVRAMISQYEARARSVSKKYESGAADKQELMDALFGLANITISTMVELDRFKK